MSRLIFLILPLIFLLASAYPSSGALELVVDNVKLEKGKIWVGIYESEADFLDRDKARLVATKVDKTGKITLAIDALQYGEDYALAIFHDENDNGELDLNWLGLPSEPWAFSGEPKTRLRLPVFEEVNFVFNSFTRKQVLRLRKW